MKTLALATLVALVPATLPAQGGTHYFCWGQQNPQPEVYFTPAFDAPAGQIGALSSGFKTYLRQKYSLNHGTGVSCSAYGSAAEAVAGRQKRVAEVNGSNRLEMVETAWTYATATPATPASTPPAAGQPKPALSAAAASPASPAPAPAAAPAAAQQTPTAQPPAPAAPVQWADPRIAQIIEPFRTMVQQEAAGGTRGYCEFNVGWFFGIDCDQFSKVVLEYRIAHAGELHPYKGGQDNGGFQPLGSLIALKRVSCPDCIDQAKLAKNMRERVRGDYRQQLMTHMITQAKVDAVADCAVPQFAALFKADPSITEVFHQYSAALNACHP